MGNILEVKNVTKLFKNGRGIKDISFNIEKGEIFGFLGPNGAGKTTLMKTVTGLSSIKSGSIKLFGFDISKQYEKAVEKVGSVIETPDSYEHMSAYDNLKLISRFYKDVDKTRIDETLELVGLSPVKKEKAGNFSLGMKERLALAAALLSRPEFIILDEPTNGLDIEGVVQIRNIIKTLHEKENITFFISSHAIHEIELVCTRIGIINNGEMLDVVSVNDIKKYGTLEDYFLENINKSRREIANG